MTGHSLTMLLASTLLFASSNAGPLPSNLTLTSTEQATEGSCAGVTCEVRAGCKALHRPDACCPAYQCECEQDGRMYLNGEKLVDPGDPCRVCYCQGGEVVCRRIACFRRDDCRPRTVPGRCCPEYDNCPLTGESTMLASAEEATSSVPPPPPPPREVPKQEITIKEITPVSEIPAIIIDKEVSASSRAPLIVREATTDRPVPARAQTDSIIKTDLHDTHSTPVSSSDAPSSTLNLITSDASTETKSTFSSPATVMSSQSPVFVMEVTRPAIEEEDVLLEHNPAFPPLPDDLSVPASHDDELLPDQVTDSEPVGVTVIVNQHSTDNELVIVTEVLNDPISETYSTPVTQVVASSEPVLITQVVNLSTELPTSTPTTSKQATTSTTDTESTPAPTLASTTSTSAAPVEQSTQLTANNTIQEARTSTTQANFKASPMLNLRSAIPTEILNVPSSVQEEINGELDDIIEPTTSLAEPSSATSNSNVKIATEEAKVSTAATEVVKSEEKSSSTPSTIVTEEQKIVATEPSQPLRPEIVKTVSTDTKKPHVVQPSTIKPEPATILTFPPSSSTAATHEAIIDARTLGSSSAPPLLVITETNHDETESRQSSTASSTKGTSTEAPIPRLPPAPPVSSTSLPERTTQTATSSEISSLPVETSDQNPRDTSENIVKEVKTVSADPIAEMTELKTPVSDILTVPKEATSKTGTPAVENVETTEFIANGINWMESATDVAEEEVAPAKPSAADSAGAGVLSELIDLVGDVAAIGEQEQTIQVAEELLPVNAGYKSRHRPNANSITEPPAKGRVPTEIEEEGPVLLDAVPPARHEPTTTRTPIDGDGARPPVPSEAPPGDIEIITRSYVPTISRRPTKVVQASAELSSVNATAVVAADTAR